MLELRYNGCPDCRKSMRVFLSNCGLFEGRNYRLEMHGDHKKDKIYTKRPDYLKHFSGGILYNPDNGSWIDLYPDRVNILDTNEANIDVIRRFAGF